jgi:hypothetical protein
LRHVKQTDFESAPLRDDKDPDDESPQRNPSNLKPSQPCRILISVRGLEWLVYNRSPAYDAVEKAILAKQGVIPSAPKPPPTNTTNITNANGTTKYKGVLKKQRDPSTTEAGVFSKLSTLSSGQYPEKVSGQDDAGSTTSSENSDPMDLTPADLWMTRLLPIQFECEKGVVVLGNTNTRSVLVISCQRCRGELDLGPSKLDKYKQLINMEFEAPLIRMKPNKDFSESQEALATRLERGRQRSMSFSDHSRKWFKLHNLFSHDSDEKISDSAPAWHGLTRYIDDTEGPEDLWEGVEYAAVQTIYQGPSAKISFFWDVPTKIGQQDPTNLDINGSEPPEWGLDITVSGGSLNYGPWADRQRVGIQSMFFPRLFADSVPALRLQPGDDRVSTTFKLYLQIEEQTTLRIPIREPSKDFRYPDLTRKLKTRKDKKNGSEPEDRKYAWIDIKVAANSTVRYFTEMYAAKHGYSSGLRAELKGTEVTTSVNQDLLFKSDKETITCDLSTPLKWNTLRRWTFDITSSGMRLFLLREHINLLIDLVGDWATGPPTDYHTFTPFQYMVDLHLRNCALFFNVNESNIIDNPSSLEDNALLALRASKVDVELIIPLDKLRPAGNAIPFSGTAKRLSLDFNTPVWNTFTSFSDSKRVAVLKELTLAGYYDYFSTSSPTQTDTLVLGLVGSRGSVRLYGSLIRAFLKFIKNFFGDDVHFRTVEEHREAMRTKKPPEPKADPNRITNELDVILNIEGRELGVILPGHIYQADECISIQTENVSVDLRFTSYYMDLVVSSSPLSIALREEDRPQLFVNGLDITGHRLFGLPPVEATYMCNWDFDVRRVEGQCSAEFLVTLVKALKALLFTLDDDENALIDAANHSVPDVTFLRANITDVRLWVVMSEAAFLLSSSGVIFQFNDWARPDISQEVHLVADLEAACIDVKDLKRSHMVNDFETFGLIRTTLVFGMQKKNAEIDEKQKKFVSEQDLRTHRVWFLEKDVRSDKRAQYEKTSTQAPPIPEPLLDESTQTIADYDHQDSPGPRSSSDNASIAPYREIGTPTRSRTAGVRLPGSTNFNIPHPSGGQLLSSPYLAPPFRLMAVQPSLGPIPKNVQFDKRFEPIPSVGEVVQDDPNVVTTLFSITFQSPIIGYTSSPMLIAVAELFAALQPKETEDFIDELQMAITDQLESSKRLETRPSVKKLIFNLPALQVRYLERDRAETSSDILVNVSNLAVCLQSNAASEASKTGISLSLDSASVVATHPEDNGILEDVKAQVFDISLWFLAQNGIHLDLHIRDAESAVDSTNIDRLYNLIKRLELLSGRLKNRIGSVGQQRKVLLHNLIAEIILAGEQKDVQSDPPFLTTPTYITGGQSTHLRMHDSWKIIARLRHISRLTSKAKRKPVAKEGESIDLRNFIVQKLRDWQSLELKDPNESLFIQELFGSNLQVIEEAVAGQLKLTVTIGAISLSIFTRPSESSFSISGLRLDIVRLADKLENMQVDLAPERGALMVYFDLNRAAVNLNWDLLRAVEEFIKYLPEPTPSSVEQRSHQTLPLLFAKERVQMLFSIHNASISFVTINVTLECHCSEFVCSAVYNELLVPDAFHSALLSVGTVGVSMFSGNSAIFAINLTKTLLSIGLRDRNDQPLRLEASASCGKLSTVISEDILGVIAVVDVLIRDEVDFVFSLATRLPRQESKPKIKTQSRNFSLTAVFLLDSYSFTLALLPSLVYIVNGEAISLSVAPGTPHLIELDIGSQDHEFRTDINDSWHSVSTFKLPTVNARASITSSNDVKVVDATMAIQPILIEASAGQSLFKALNRPELLRIFQDASADAKRAAEDWKHVSRPLDLTERKKSPISTSSPAIIFFAKAWIAGVGVHSTAPSANLDLKFNGIQVYAANSTDRETRSEHPEVQVNLHHVVFELARSDDESRQPCGNIDLSAQIRCSSKLNEHGKMIPVYEVQSEAATVNLFANTASTVVDVIGHLQGRIKDMDFSREVEYLRRLRRSRVQSLTRRASIASSADSEVAALFSSLYSLQFSNIQVSWIVSRTFDFYDDIEPEDLVLSIKSIELSTRRDNTAQLLINEFMVEMLPQSYSGSGRSANSAVLPQIIFSAAYLGSAVERKFSFNAVGKSVHIQLTPQFVLPASYLQQSVAEAASKFRSASASWKTIYANTGLEDKPLLTSKRLASLSIDADFAGAVVYLHSAKASERSQKAGKSGLHGLYGQLSTNDPNRSAVLRTPGLAFKIEYTNAGNDQRTLNAEFKIDGSENTFFPEVVPLISEMTASIKEVVRDKDEATTKPKSQPKPKSGDDKLNNTDPAAILGSIKLNVGFRIARQEFSLSCQPIARVAATSRFEYVYITINTVKPPDSDTFFAISAVVSQLQASVQHVYSRDSTASFEIDNLVLSLMNSRHVSGTSGLFAILQISPMKTKLSVKQLQDFMLFREIWLPEEARATTTPNAASQVPETHAHLVKRYQQVAAASAFPWTASIAIEAIDIDVDFGQALGRSSLNVSSLWVISEKNSDWEQNLCAGLGKIEIVSSGRLSGFIQLQELSVRTSIQWPAGKAGLTMTPLVQASAGFGGLRAKVAFDYQTFLIADITRFVFLMYNVKDASGADRLVGTLDGDGVQIYCTTSSASQALALIQAIERLGDEKREAFDAAVRDVERVFQRKSMAVSNAPKLKSKVASKKDQINKPPGTLHTDVAVTIKQMSVGAFPNTFLDLQVFKVLALETQFRFAVTNENGRTHSDLSMELGQLRVALSSINRSQAVTEQNEVEVEEVVSEAAASRGGTILKVPKLVASMETWQQPENTRIEYIFRSTFEGRVDVGWNYTRISFIRGMWDTHSRTFTQRLGKPIEHPAVIITGAPDSSGDGTDSGSQGKITAVVNVPLSKYQYVALQPPIIETPQLRDMGEATPPLEWIGLNRDRLPNITHQVSFDELDILNEVEY